MKAAELISDWVQRLHDCAPRSPAAIDVYKEAQAAGLVAELKAELRRTGEAMMREANALEREGRDRVVRVVK